MFSDSQHFTAFNNHAFSVNYTIKHLHKHERLPHPQQTKPRPPKGLFTRLPFPHSAKEVLVVVCPREVYKLFHGYDDFSANIIAPTDSTRQIEQNATHNSFIGIMLVPAHW